MAGPIDYGIQAPDIAGGLLGGIQAGQQLAAGRAKTEAANLAVQQQKQYAADLQTYLQNPTPQGAAAMTVKYPEQREAFKQSWDLLDEAQQGAQYRSGVQVYSALQNNSPEVAKQIVDQQIEAMENSGEDASNYKMIRDAIERNPSGAAAQIGLTLSALEPDKWAKVMGEMRESQLAPSKLTESQAKASKAATDAKFAESAAVQDLAKGGWEIQKLANDINISRQNAQIAALNAATAREGNSIKKQELQLKLQDKIAARDAKVNEKVAEVSSARATIDNMLNTADRVLQTPVDVISSAAGPVSSKLPTLSSDTSDFEELLNTLSSQAFMAQIPALKGMGALSNAEGEKLQSSLQNLSLRQSPERLVENVKEAQRLILKSRANLSDKFGVPDVTPDTPASAPSPTNIDALLQKYGGAQ